MTCPYCHAPFKPILYAQKDGYTEAFYGLEDDKGVYFGFHEERPDHDYSNVAIDFAYCPMCGRKINDNPQNTVLKWNGKSD